MRIAQLRLQRWLLDVQGKAWAYSESYDCILIIGTVKLPDRKDWVNLCRIYDRITLRYKIGHGNDY